MSGKLEVFDGKQTNWSGLWWQPNCMYFSSGVISLSELRKFKGNVRMVVRKNIYFNKGENNRPNYVFAFRDAKSENPYELETRDIKTRDTLIKELAEVMREGRSNGDVVRLPSESISRAESLHDRAIEIIEELTGEEWEFSFITL